MAFRLTSKDSVGEALKRGVQREIERAISELRARDRGSEAAFDARKRFKRVRAALRLVRDELGDAVYQRENRLFRDAARSLTELRDAAVGVEALDRLIGQFAIEIKAGAFDDVRRALVATHQAVLRRVLDADEPLAGAARMVAPARARIADWTFERDGWPALRSGLRRVYRAGRRARARATAEPSVENLHEWRKQAKYLWHHLQFLEPAWIPRENDLASRVRALTRVLGEDHDLAMLREAFTADPGAHGGHRVLGDLLALLARRHATLTEQAFALGRTLYADAPLSFTNRVEGYWNVWTPGTGSPPKSRARPPAAAGAASMSRPSPRPARRSAPQRTGSPRGPGRSTRS